jgi:hypothetical protein
MSVSEASRYTRPVAEFSLARTQFQGLARPGAPVEHFGADRRSVSLRAGELTGPMDDEGIEKATPLMNDLREGGTGFDCGNNHHLAREAPLREESGPCCLPSTRHDQETLPVVPLGIASRPLRFASGISGDVHEAHDRHPLGLGARGVSVFAALREEQYRRISLLSERHGQGCSGAFVGAVEAQNAIDVPGLVLWREHDEPERCRDEERGDQNDDADDPAQPPTPSAPALWRPSNGGSDLILRALLGHFSCCCSRCRIHRLRAFGRERHSGHHFDDGLRSMRTEPARMPHGISPLKAIGVGEDSSLGIEGRPGTRSLESLAPVHAFQETKEIGPSARRANCNGRWLAGFLPPPRGLAIHIERRGCD